MAKTIAALFDDRTEAYSAVQDLVDHGVPRDDISVMTHDGSRSDSSTTTADVDDGPSGMAMGAGVGATLGGIAGLVIGLSALAVPGVGPVIAAGPLAAALIGAGVGAATGGLVGALMDLGIPEEHANYYSEGVRRGGVLVTVATTDEKAEQAVSIMSRHHPVDVSRRAEEWRQSGWTRFDHQAQAYRAPGATRAVGTTPEREAQTVRAAAGAPTGSGRAFAAGTTSVPRDQADRETTIPIVEEELQVGKRATERDIRVHTTVQEKPVEEQVRLREEHVTVERRPVNRPVTAADQTAFKEGTTEITETVEEAVVSKRARVVEEVVINKESTEHVETIHDTVRHTNVEVDQGRTSQASSPRAFETYEPAFRTHFNTTFSKDGGTYNTYTPAYRYGYTIATDKRYDNRNWDAISSEVQRDWDRDHPGTWERFKSAVRHAWDEVRGRR